MDVYADKRYPEEVFPELVWRKVFSKLTNKDDIDSCFNASPYFRELLRERREVEVLLPTIFQILKKRYSDMKLEDESLFLETNLETLPWFRPKAMDGHTANIRKNPNQMSGFWKCRLVCKKWNNAIEETYRNETAGHFRMWDGLFDNYYLRSSELNFYKFEHHVTNFVRHFEATHYDVLHNNSKKCPFLDRSVTIMLNWSHRSIPAFLNSFLEMLVQYGREVYYFEFICLFISGAAEEQVSVYQQLKQVVGLMPNLKVLRVKHWFISKHQTQALLEEMERNPFPRLAKLEMISVYEIPGVLCNHIVNQNQQIRRLELSGINFGGECAVLMNHLSHIRWTVESVEDYESFERYDGIINLKMFNFYYLKDLAFLPWLRVFNAIGSKINSDSCTDLQLLLPEPTTDPEQESVLKDSLLSRLRLANIERFKMKQLCRFHTEFLLNSKNSLREVVLL